MKETLYTEAKALRITDAEMKKLRGENWQSVREPYHKWLKILDGNIDEHPAYQFEPWGMDTTEFMQNPLFIWAHGMSGLPVHVLGKVLELRAFDGCIFAHVQYATEAEYCFADQIYRLDIAGYLPANAFGFHPIEEHTNEYGSRVFTKWGIVEVSKVELPFKSDAVAGMVLETIGGAHA